MLKALLLAGGYGTRLKPLTDHWPKCLMPIHKRPLLEYWLGALYRLGIDDVLVNLHYLQETVSDFLQQPQFEPFVKTTYEKELLGTAGTLRANSGFFGESTVMVVHADNWSCCDFFDFIDFHNTRRPKDTLITMMTFNTSSPSSCGIVELDSQGIVIDFHEKVANPPGNIANAAVYLIEPEVIQWLINNIKLTDFSTEVLPRFIGRIATWENKDIHKDIGTIDALKSAQKDKCSPPPWPDNKWQQLFEGSYIQQQVN